MERNDVLMEQEELFFESLNAKDKRKYFIKYFESELVLALKRTRKEAKITQVQLAKRMGVKQAYVSKIENLEKTPTIETIAKYLFGLDYSLKETTVIITEVTQKNNCLPVFSLSKVKWADSSDSSGIVYARSNCGESSLAWGK